MPGRGTLHPQPERLNQTLFHHPTCYTAPCDTSTQAPVADTPACQLSDISPFLYEPSFVAVRGQTLGKMAAGVKVVRLEDGNVPGWGASLGRWVLPNLAIVVPWMWILCLLVYVSLLWGPSWQGWHDRVVSTVVISVQ